MEDLKPVGSRDDCDSIARKELERADIEVAAEQVSEDIIMRDRVFSDVCGILSLEKETKFGLFRTRDRWAACGKIPSWIVRDIKGDPCGRKIEFLYSGSQCCACSVCTTEELKFFTITLWLWGGDRLKQPCS